MKTKSAEICDWTYQDSSRTNLWLEKLAEDSDLLAKLQLLINVSNYFFLYRPSKLAFYYLWVLQYCKIVNNLELDVSGDLCCFETNPACDNRSHSSQSTAQQKWRPKLI